MKTGSMLTLAGCLRNYRAVAQAAQNLDQRIAVIPAGERWKSDGSLRSALEDWIAAGAIISQLNGKLSPEARAAAAAFQRTQSDIKHCLRQCGSGKELIERGLEGDVVLAAELDVSDCVPILKDGAYQKWKLSS